MAWDRRGNRRYFYRSIRTKGRVFRQYVGMGEPAAKAAAEIEGRRARQRALAESLRSESQRHAAALAPLDELCHLTDVLTKATLISHGYHQHSRGAWRRKRNGRDQRSAAAAQDFPRAESSSREGREG